MVDKTFCHAWLKIWWLQEAQEQLVNELQMRPRGLQRGLILLRIEFGTIRVGRWRQSSEKVDSKLMRTDKYVVVKACDIILNM